MHIQHTKLMNPSVTRVSVILWWKTHYLTQHHPQLSKHREIRARYINPSVDTRTLYQVLLWLQVQQGTFLEITLSLIQSLKSERNSYKNWNGKCCGRFSLISLLVSTLYRIILFCLCELFLNSVALHACGPHFNQLVFSEKYLCYCNHHYLWFIGLQMSSNTAV